MVQKLMGIKIFPPLQLYPLYNFIVDKQRGSKLSNFVSDNKKEQRKNNRKWHSVTDIILWITINLIINRIYGKHQFN